MTFSEDRFNQVNQARQEWITRLIDLSRRNNLLYYRDLRTGTLDLSQSDPAAISDLMRGEVVPLTRLVSEESQEQAVASILNIHRRALTNLEEKGLETLYLALDMATWIPTDRGRPPAAPIILMPIHIEHRRVVRFQRRGEAQVNPVLLHCLEVEYDCEVTPQDLLQESIAEDEPPDCSGIAERLRQVAHEIQGFDVQPRLILSNFSFQKMAMVRDLQEHLSAMAAHNVIAAIAGVEHARQTTQRSGQEINPRTLDQIPPDQEFLVFDADSSQQKVVYDVLSNRNCVIQGPPGTGKSQTIANLITALAARGLKTLFVAEKRAALEVVMQRLQQRGLGHLLLDLHSADISRREISRQFADSLDIVRRPPLVNTDDIHRQFQDRRERLNSHVSQLHRQRPPAQKSVYELQGELLHFSQEEQSSTRLRGRNLERLTPDMVGQVDRLLQELSGGRLADLFQGKQTSLWNGIQFSSDDDARHTIEQVEQIADELYPDLEAALLPFTSTTGFRSPSTLKDAKAQISLAKAASDSLSRYPEDLFRQNLEQQIQALDPLRQGFLSERLAQLFDGKFKNTIHTLRQLRRSEADSDKQILEEVTQAAAQLRQWRLYSSSNSFPCRVPNLDNLEKRFNALFAKLPSLETVLGKGNLSQMPLNEFFDLFRTLSAERELLERIRRIQEIEKELNRLGVQLFLNDLRRTQPSPSLWRRQFKYVWLSSCLERARSETPELIGFHGITHDQIVQEFRDLDEQRLQIAVQRVQRAHAEQAIRVMNEYPEQEDLIRRQAERSRRHLPLRKLVAQAPDVLMTLRPCWMASPLTVSQHLEANRQYFDVVIFDEASQVLPEDAIPAIMRARRIVVAGDRHQLPPTTFFATGTEEGDEEAELPAAGFESFLNLMSSILRPQMLEWHYRSRCEELIAFSNRHIYDNRLITFPNPGCSRCISHILVPSELGLDRQEESAAREVRYVVDLVLQHATERPEQTLGVITMGVRHANRIEAVLAQALKNRPELDHFFDDSRPERFFVKNIERVQGDERDAIILSVGYGKDRSGRLPYRFGPLLYEGGERRLNVAITRARQCLTLVSSFDHHDMDPSRSMSRGVELLRLYLQYAASGGRLLGDAGCSDVPLNPFEQDVFDALSDRGISLQPQWGASGYRIDMVAQHPQQPGQFVLAIECDGASYHSLPTVRERDRLRQKQLESLGWRFHRIWSTDWFSQRAAEIERAVVAYEAAVEYANQREVQVIQPQSEPVESEPVESEPVESEPVESEPVESEPPPEPPTESSVDEPPQSDIPPSEPPTEPWTCRGSRPEVPHRDRIDQYSQDELIELVRWIRSDGILRTDAEILNEMVRELGFSRRGRRIEERVLAAIQCLDERDE